MVSSASLEIISLRPPKEHYNRHYYTSTMYLQAHETLTRVARMDHDRDGKPSGGPFLPTEVFDIKVGL